MSQEGGFFSKIANDVLDATEKLTARMEDGLSAMLTAVQGDGTIPASDSQEIQDDDLDASPLQGIAESVLGGIMKGQVGNRCLFATTCSCKKHGRHVAYNNNTLYSHTFSGSRLFLQKGPQTLLEQFHAFRYAIRWTEPFVVGLIFFQMVLLVAALGVSRRGVGIAPRLVLMVTIGAIVRGAEYINAYCAKNWEAIATQNYFDTRGIFISVMLCIPLLVDCFIMLLFFLREASTLLVQVKRAELKQTRQKKQKNL
jgi:hypothetical protein